jgi:hypothetical protein
MIHDWIAQGWERFLAKPNGPLNLRFILQPSIAGFMAIRAGVKDAKAGRPAFLWEAITNPDERRALVHGGWKDMSKTFLISAILDAVYQFIVNRAIYPVEMLFTATLLALVPYFLLRGPVNRIARWFKAEG